MKTSSIASGTPSLRRTARVQHCGRISIPKLKLQLLAGRNAESDFTLHSAPISPYNQTSFVAVGDGRRLLVGVCLLESKRTDFANAPFSQERYLGNVEILFDLRRDGHGFCHYLFSSDGVTLTNDFSPYPEARSSRWELPKVSKWKFESQTFAKERGYLVHWLWAWFDIKDIFQHSDVIGFNVCRYDECRGEWSAWNFSAGFGFPDGQSLGFLCRGKASPSIPKLPSCPHASRFSISMLNDVPDTVIPQPYTPASIDAEMKALRDWGFDRAEWIDYSNMPSFWEQPAWKKNYQKTFAKCSDLIRLAVRSAHKHQLEFIADLKLLDLATIGGTQNFHCTAKTPGALMDWNGEIVAGTPDMEGHEEAFMQSNPAWRKKAEFPIRRLRFYSSTEIPLVKASEITVSVSRDNKRYTIVDSSSYSVRVVRHRRRHTRWEPDGCHMEDGHFQNWMLEISGLDCRTPYLGIECSKTDIKFTNPAFLFVEAEDASGNISPVEIAPRLYAGGSSRFSFYPYWQGWSNHNEWIVNPGTWSLSAMGLAFVDPVSLPGLLEPTHPDSQRIWLDRIQELLDRGIDGISLRILCHHNNAASWLKYAFGPTVIEAFSKEHGRLPEAVEGDFIKIRKIRGEAITELLREVRRRCEAPRRKVIFQIETGAELPPEIGNRMQIHFDYEQWMKEGLVDEFHVRSITGHCPWLREYLLPLAKRHGVQVHLISRNLHSQNGLEMQAVPVFDRIVRDAIEAGYDGFTFYETAGLYEIGSEGTVVAKGLSQPAMEAAVRSVTNASLKKGKNPKRK